MSEPIRLGIIGIGRAGWGMHCAELEGKEDLFTIAAACDVIGTRTARMEERYGCRTYEAAADLIADPDVEVVVVATRSVDHFAQAMAALAAGKLVFLEKPICLTYDQACQLQQAADGRLYIRHNRRFEPAFIKIREIMAAGLLGDVFEVKLRRISFQRRDDWQTLKEFGGGQCLNWGPHIIDHGLRLLESPLADLWSDLKLVAAAGDAEDHLKIIMRGANGRVVDLEISGGAALGEPEWTVYGTRGALTGSGNTVHLKYLDPAQPLAPRHPDPSTPEEGFGTPDALVWVEEDVEAKSADDWGIWDKLYAAIRDGAEFPVKLAEAVQVMEVVSRVKAGTPFA